jgi:hypothetical protein
MSNRPTYRQAHAVIRALVRSPGTLEALELVEQDSRQRGAEDWARLEPAVALLTRLLTDEDWSLWLLEQRLVGLAASGN